jgi:hypothetical protein
MPIKRSGKGSPAAKGAPADFVTWKARAAADLKRQHNVNPGIIPLKASSLWRPIFPVSCPGSAVFGRKSLVAIFQFPFWRAADRFDS